MKLKLFLGVVAGVCSCALLLSALSETASVGAAPSAPQAGGTFTVNGTGDNTDYNGLLTLREALRLAKGGTDGFSGLSRGLSDGERAQVSGCNWSGSSGDWHTTTGCGTGVADTVDFDNSLGSNPTIVLNSQLPNLDDSASTVIDGGSVVPLIDASVNPTAAVGLTIVTDGNVVKHLKLNASTDGIFIIGAGANNNTIFDVWVWSASEDGIDIIDGSSNLINQSYIGVSSTSASNCSANKGNGRYGVIIDNLSTTTGGHDNVIKNSYIGCNGQAGIAIDSSAASNIIGPNNVIGTNAAHSGDLGNNGRGVWVNSDYNQIETNTIAFNSDGVYLTGNFNGLAGNSIRRNTADGIRIVSGAQFNTIGRPSLLGALSGNQIGKNMLHGIEITGTATASNFVAGNEIGVMDDAVTADGNSVEGIRISGAHDNVIGDNGSAHNIIGFNGGDGIELTNGAYNNAVANNYIGTEPSKIFYLVNSGDGVLIHSGAHDNILGGSFTLGNYIEHNGLRGIEILDSSTAANTINDNDISFNTQSGIRLSDGTHDNLTIDNDVRENGQNGIALANGAHDNLLTLDFVRLGNARNGFELSGAGTTGNVISQALIYANTYDGINERSGADNNKWTLLSVHDNGGLGIDKNGAVDTTNDIDRPYPTITTVALSGGVVTVKGKATATQTPPTVSVELYRASTDPSGFGEGKTFLGADTTDANGNWTVSFSSATVGCYTAFQTVRNSGVSTSSEFGPNSCRVFLPLIER